MDIYVLDLYLKRAQVIDYYESFVWTERYSSYGDFVIVMPDTPFNRATFYDGVLVTTSNSDRVMIVEDLKPETTDDGKSTLTITGRSIERVLSDRLVTPNDGLSWVYSDDAASLVARLVNENMVNGTGVTPNDVLDNLYVANTTSGLTSLDVSVKITDLYSAITNICDSEKLGFKIQILPTEPRFRFNVYQGSDRSGVIFSSVLDTLSNERHFHSSKDHKNIAYVYGKDGANRQLVPGNNVDINRTGLRRRVLYVDASDIKVPSPVTNVYLNQLYQRGREELTKHNKIDVFDGSITDLNTYEYGVDYSLGDAVSLMDRNGRKYSVRITEFIWSVDRNGLRGYPTFVSTDEWE